MAKRRRHNRRVLITVAVILALLAAVIMIFFFRTYDSVQVLKKHGLNDAGSNRYESFAGGILRYNSDGVSLMNASGEDKWNQAVQMQQPVAAVNGGYAAVADVNGTAVCIFDKKGLTGEASCARPVERVSVSGDGVVTVIQENGETPVVSCYDKDGKLLLEHQAALTESGYPLAAAVSDDGEVMAVSYLQVTQQGADGRVIYYDIKTKNKDKVLYSKKFDDEAIGEIFFIGDTSVVIGEKQCRVYKGYRRPEEQKRIKVSGQIEKIFRDGRYFGWITRAESGKCKLSVYTGSGDKKLDKQIQGSFEKVSFSDKQILLWSGREGQIYTLRGVHRFDGQLQDEALHIKPLKGLNRYAVVTNDGISTVRLTR